MVKTTPTGFAKVTEDDSGALDITKILKQLRLPGIDVNGMVEAQRKDIEALRSASQHARDGFQMLVEKQTEMLKAAMSHFQSLAKDQSVNATERSQQAEDALGAAVRSMRELAEMSVRANEEAFNALSDRARERITQLLQSRR